MTKFDSTKPMREDAEIEGTSRKLMDHVMGKKGKKGRSKKPRSKEPRGPSRRQSGEGTRPNDISWAMKNPQLIRDVASLPFGAMLGTGDKSVSTTMFTNGYVVPGLMTLYWVPGLGVSDDLTSPINVTARGVYSYVRKANSGARNYESADLMMYLMAKDSLDAFHAMLKRTYGVLRLYSAYNRYYARTLLRAMGWDPINLEGNVAQLRAFTNLVADKLGNLATPDNMPVFKRHRHMSEKLYVDGKGTEAQTYLFVPLHFWRFDNTSSTGSSLVPVTWFDPTTQLQSSVATESIKWNTGYKAGAGHTLMDAVAIFNQLYTGIMLDEDFGTMSGDILKAFPESAITDLGTISEDYVVTPEYSQEILSEIENARIVANMNPASYIVSNTVTQDPSINNGAIKTNLSVQFELYSLPSSSVQDILNGECLLNFHWDNPTPEDVVTATRFSCDPTITLSGTSTVMATAKPNNYGTEVIVGALMALAPFDVLPIGATGIDTPYAPVPAFWLHAPSESAWTLRAYGIIITTMTNFDWAPIFRVFSTTSSSDTTAEFNGFFGDMEQYAYVASSVLKSIHEAVLLSYFDVTR